MDRPAGRPGQPQRSKAAADAGPKGQRIRAGDAGPRATMAAGNRKARPGEGIRRRPTVGTPAGRATVLVASRADGRRVGAPARARRPARPDRQPGASRGSRQERRCGLTRQQQAGGSAGPTAGCMQKCRGLPRGQPPQRQPTRQDAQARRPERTGHDTVAAGGNTSGHFVAPGRPGDSVFPLPIRLGRGRIAPAARAAHARGE